MTPWENVSSEVVPGGDLAKVMRACCMISNSTVAERMTMGKSPIFGWLMVMISIQMVEFSMGRNGLRLRE